MRASLLMAAAAIAGMVSLSTAASAQLVYVDPGSNGDYEVDDYSFGYSDYGPQVYDYSYYAPAPQVDGYTAAMVPAGPQIYGWYSGPAVPRVYGYAARRPARVYAARPAPRVYAARTAPRVYGYTRRYNGNGNGATVVVNRGGNCGTFYYWNGVRCVNARNR